MVAYQNACLNASHELDDEHEVTLTLTPTLTTTITTTITTTLTLTLTLTLTPTLTLGLLHVAGATV